MYPGYAKDSPLRAFTKLLGDTSVQRVIKSTQLGNALNRRELQDRLYLAMRRFAPNGGRFFRHGWGDIARAGRFERKRSNVSQLGNFLTIIGQPVMHDTQGYKIIGYRAESPWVKWLPQESHPLCQVVTPLRAPRALAFHFPCTGDEDLNIAGSVALNLLDRGIASVLPMITITATVDPRPRPVVREFRDRFSPSAHRWLHGSLSLHRWLRQKFQISPWHLPV